MAKYFYCSCCKQRKEKNPRIKSGQRYCGSKACQQARKNEHERLKNDPGYYAKRKAQKATWQNKQQGSYHKTYRANHADYTSGNLILQKTRYQKAKTCPVPGVEPKIVKTDTLTSATTCELKLKKMDLSLSCLRIIRPVQLERMQESLKRFGQLNPADSKKAGRYFSDT